MRPALAAALALLLAGPLAACGARSAGGDARRRGARHPRVITRPVGTRTITYLVRATGSLEALQIVTVPTRVAGVVEAIAFDVGSKVGPDDVLLTVDHERHMLEARGAKAELDKAGATLERVKAQGLSAQASLDEARANLARRQALKKKLAGAVTDEAIEAARTQVARLEASVKESGAAEAEQEAAVRQAQAAYDLALEDQRDAEVRAPLSGVVERRLVSIGQYVHPGDAVAILVDRSVLRLRFRVGERQSVRIHASDAVSFTVAALPERTFQAHLVHVSAAADPDTRMVECLADVEHPGPELKPGFFAQVSVHVGGSPHALVVPERAVRATEDGYVAFVIEDGVAQRRVLDLGLHTDDGFVEVLHGLHAGDALVVQGAGALDDGVHVDVLPDTPPAAGPGAKEPR
jgi:multidrug efflux system membrane fusion protein